jgi:molybdopterin molybdotransferase
VSFISYETSLNMLELLTLPEPRGEKVFLSDALGRTLFENVVAGANYPKFPTAAMDGYAIVCDDQEWGEIAVMGDNPAGSTLIGQVESGHCIKTFTGSRMPEGADTLIPIENVTFDGEKIIINKSVKRGFSVRPVGESYRQGEVLISKGSTISFAQIGVMAGLDMVMVDVVRKPKVAIVATGSEILDIGEVAQHENQIRSTNHITIEALAKMAGAEVIRLGVVNDNFEAIMATLESALCDADMIVSTGGVSVGDYDFVKDIIPKLGADIIYKGVRIKPGQHIILAQKESKILLALPGFAYSSTVTFILYGIPLIGRYLGKEHVLELVEASLRVPFKKRSGKSEFTACNLSFEEGRYWVDFEGKKSGSSAILTNLLGATALMVSGEEDGDLDAGMAVHVIKLERFL